MEHKVHLPNPDISSVASLLHAQDFHILFFSCSVHFPETREKTRIVTLNLSFGNSGQALN